jgi:hypothetical protein
MRVKFLKTTRYSEDGFVVYRGKKYQIRHVADSAARALVSNKCAVPVAGQPDICAID